jgi:hypothetical protein
VPGADPDANAGDRNYLVLVKPNVIMYDTRLRGLAVAGNDAAGRQSPHNHAQTARNVGIAQGWTLAPDPRNTPKLKTPAPAT